MAITAKQVKELRDATSVSMMKCKKALVETDGDFDAALRILREAGVAAAAKRSDRESPEGCIAAEVTADAQTASIIQVSCETDFVSRNEDFQSFVKGLLSESFDYETGTMAEAKAAVFSQKVISLGENINLAKQIKWDVSATGAIASYIHMGGTVGVLVEFGFENEATKDAAEFKEVAKNLCLHVAAAAPQYLNRDEVEASFFTEEMDIARKQLEAEGKPEKIMENILKGKANKLYSQVCFLEQGFVMDDKVSVTKLLEGVNKTVNDTITVKRFTRLQLG